VGAFAVVVQIEIESGLVTMNFRFAATSDHYPNDLLPALGFMRHAAHPNLIEARVGPERLSLGPPTPPPTVVPIDDGYVRLVEDLARLQRETRTFFKMPAAFTPTDLREIEEGVQLLDGNEVELDSRGARYELLVVEPGSLLATLEDKQEAMAIHSDGQCAASIAGYTLPLGKSRTYSPAVRVTNMDEIRAVLGNVDLNEDGVKVPIEVETLDASTFTLKLLPD
jgi:hypothetical protein